MSGVTIENLPLADVRASLSKVIFLEESRGPLVRLYVARQLALPSSFGLAFHQSILIYGPIGTASVLKIAALEQPAEEVLLSLLLPLRQLLLQGLAWKVAEKAI